MYDLFCLYPVFQAFWCQEPFLGTYVGESWTAQSWQPFLYAHWAWHHRLQNKVCINWILKYCSLHLCSYNITFCSLPLPIIILFIKLYNHCHCPHDLCTCSVTAPTLQLYLNNFLYLIIFYTVLILHINVTRAFLDDVAHRFQTSSSNDQRIIHKFSNKDFILKKNL